MTLKLKLKKKVLSDYKKALQSPDPDPLDFDSHEFAATEILEEKGERSPAKGGKSGDGGMQLFTQLTRFCANILKAMFYGQDVGGRLGGVFREAATLAQKYGEHRVFNTPIQEAYIVGSTAGMSAVGVKPIVEIQFCRFTSGQE